MKIMVRMTDRASRVQDVERLIATALAELLQSNGRAPDRWIVASAGLRGHYPDTEAFVVIRQDDGAYVGAAVSVWQEYEEPTPEEVLSDLGIAALELGYTRDTRAELPPEDSWNVRWY